MPAADDLRPLGAAPGRPGTAGRGGWSSGSSACRYRAWWDFGAYAAGQRSVQVFSAEAPSRSRAS